MKNPQSSEDMNAAQLLLSLSDRSSLNANLLSYTTITPSVSPSPPSPQPQATKPLKPHPKFRVKVTLQKTQVVLIHSTNTNPIWP